MANKKKKSSQVVGDADIPVRNFRYARKAKIQSNSERIRLLRLKTKSIELVSDNAGEEVSPHKSAKLDKLHRSAKSKRRGRRSLKDQTISSDLDNSVLLGASDNEKQGKYLNLQTVRN
jgi:hypothetical protein